VDKDERLIAEETLKHLFVGSSVDGMQFGLSPATTKIYFTHYGRNSDEDFVFLNIESKWSIYPSDTVSFPGSEIAMMDMTEEEEYWNLYKIRRQKVTQIKIGEMSPHLYITLESGLILFVNGFHEKYECWQSGVLFDDSWLVVACPGNGIAIWAPTTEEKD